ATAERQPGPGRVSGSGSVAQHREKVAAGAGQYEKVPDEVPVSQPGIGGEEPDTRHVGKASRAEQQQPLRRNAFEERLERYQAEPSHQQIKTERGERMLDAVEGLESDTDDGQPPDHAEQRPTPRTVQRAKRERRIGAGDQQED